MSRRQPRPFRPAVVRHYTDATHKTRCKSTDPGATPRKERLDTFYAKVGGKKVSLGTQDEGQAWERLRVLLRRRAEGRAGLRDAYADHAEKPLADHLREYLAILKAKGTGEAQRSKLASEIPLVSAEAGWTLPPDVDADSFRLALGRLAERRDLSARTQNQYLAHVKQFTRWLARSGRLPADPLDGLSPRPVEEDLRHERRCPTDEEVGRLLAYLALPTAKVRKGMSGPQRALGYQVAMAAGLRAGELSGLDRQAFDLDAGTVTVRAAYDKRRRRVTLPLPPWLVAQLRAWFAAGGGCWPFPRKAGSVLLRDLTAAGVAYTVPGPDGAPLFFDFHSLRVWYCTRLAEQPGIDVKTLMDLCRHSDPRLTLRVYAKGNADRRREAADRLPQPQASGQPGTPGFPPVDPAPETPGGNVTNPDETSMPERARRKPRGKGKKG
jgi:integrase